LLSWYDRHRRDLPWRAKPGNAANPYHVWLSEIMLQQTTVAAAGPYFHKFVGRWPHIDLLAAAPLDDVLAAWAGLGYYARARNLHRAAREIATDFGGAFPSDFDQLLALPGVGTYTAGAIAAIAFGAREVAVDGNAERVLARYFGVETPLPTAKPRLRELARSLLPRARTGDFAQALMDLGATVCTPKSPGCGRCPWRANCRARQLAIAESLPRKAEKRPRPVRRGAAFVAQDVGGAILLERRPENGLLGGMMQPPMTEWSGVFPRTEEAIRSAPVRGDWIKREGKVRHAFTHFELELEVYAATVARRRNDQRWVERSELPNVALPTVMRKILDHALR
jgi:A/G-specific adenine glycosylase